MDNGVEVRESSRLSRAEFEVILEQIFKDCAERPKPPPPLTEHFKQRREKAALVSELPGFGVTSLHMAGSANGWICVQETRLVVENTGATVHRSVAT